MSLLFFVTLFILKTGSGMNVLVPNLYPANSKAQTISRRSLVLIDTYKRHFDTKMKKLELKNFLSATKSQNQDYCLALNTRCNSETHVCSGNCRNCFGDIENVILEEGSELAGFCSNLTYEEGAMRFFNLFDTNGNGEVTPREVNRTLSAYVQAEIQSYKELLREISTLVESEIAKLASRLEKEVSANFKRFFNQFQILIRRCGNGENLTPDTIKSVMNFSCFHTDGKTEHHNFEHNQETDVESDNDNEFNDNEFNDNDFNVSHFLHATLPRMPFDIKPVIVEPTNKPTHALTPPPTAKVTPPPTAKVTLPPTAKVTLPPTAKVTPPPTAIITPAPTTDAPTPAPTTDAPTPAPTTDAPTPAPTTDSPTPAPTTDAPTPAPTTDSPTPAPTTDAPTPAPTTDAPTPAPTTDAPTPAPTTDAPTPAPTTDAPTPAPTTGAPTPAPTTGAPTPAPTTGAPTPAPTTGAPTPAPTTGAPTPAPTTEAPTPAPTANTSNASDTSETSTSEHHDTENDKDVDINVNGMFKVDGTFKVNGTFKLNPKVLKDLELKYMESAVHKNETEDMLEKYNVVANITFPGEPVSISLSGEPVNIDVSDEPVNIGLSNEPVNIDVSSESASISIPPALFKLHNVIQNDSDRLNKDKHLLDEEKKYFAKAKAAIREKEEKLFNRVKAQIKKDEDQIQVDKGEMKNELSTFLRKIQG